MNTNTYNYNSLFSDFPDVLSVKQLQSALQIGRNKAYELIKNNSLKYFKVGKEIKIPKQFLIDYVLNSCYNGDATGKLQTEEEVSA